MRNPVTVLENLKSKSCNENYKFERLYRNLYNSEFYLLAYSNIYAKEGNMTKGMDGKTIDGMSMSRMQGIIDAVKNHSYKPYPARRQYIKKKNGKLRPLGMPSIDDKLVQEIAKMILENIYEDTFSNKSHGFRPNKSCHTALNQIQVSFTGVKWFIEGDIKAFFDNIDHQILISILRKRIQDEYFIGLIWKFLKAGYVENWRFHKTYSGTPQGSVISPILSNIYLNELDKYMEEYQKEFCKGACKKENPVYRKIRKSLESAKLKYAVYQNTNTTEKNELYMQKIREIKKDMMKVRYSDEMDKEYRRFQYVRYADDFIIGIIGNKDDATTVKTDIKSFLQTRLKLEMSEEKTLITNSKDKARFLSFDITTSKNNVPIRNKHGNTFRSHFGRIKLYIPKEIWMKKLLELKALKISYGKDKKEIWKPSSRPYLKDLNPMEILKQCNAEIRGLYNYYKIANNATILHKFKYVIEYSMYKTLAQKYKSNISSIKKKFNINGKFGIMYNTKKEQKTLYFYDDGFKRCKSYAASDTDTKPVTRKYNTIKSIVKRLKSGTCELCDNTNCHIQVHQVRKLKHLTGKSDWEKVMILKNRKTLALCEKCHKKVHDGNID